jgi:hypothetical protein
MMHKIDHPQYHPTRIRASTLARKAPKHQHIVVQTKQEWRGGAKVRKP